ncbi:MAG: cation-translocating P-type ATPase [Candidatus Micrarchaeota archaeon]|nr:cation-translocating P-type ATPase [Candidatus Micrarchaeota archaeon]
MTAATVPQNPPATRRQHAERAARPPHANSAGEVLERLETEEEGLEEAVAAGRLKQHGPNELSREKKRGLIRIFASQFAGYMIMLLIAAAIVASFLGEWIDSAAIIAVLILNAVMGTVQEYRAEKAIEALKKMMAPTARVIRGGVELRLPANEIVPGDVIVLEAGDRVPADARLLESIALDVNEAPLTGESMPVHKDSEARAAATAPVSERLNCIFMGTTVTAGRGKAVVYATGMSTEFGKIAKAVQEIASEETPLRQGIEKLGKRLAIAVVAACAVIFVLGSLRGIPAIDMFLTSVSLAVAAVPEGLPAVITVALAIGVQRMSGRNAVVRKLMAVETLGCANVILADKTGTITKNEMTVQKIFTGAGREGKWVEVTGTGYERSGRLLSGGKDVEGGGVPGLAETGRAAVLCNNATLLFNAEKKAFEGTGDPTEVALLVLAEKVYGENSNIVRDMLKRGAKFVQEIPFDSARKRMTVVYSFKGGAGGAGGAGTLAFMKGAPEIVLEKCTRILTPKGERILTRKDRDEILDANKKMAGNALRVLAFAQRRLNGDKKMEAGALEREMTFLGLAGMIDAPREEVPGAIELCRRAGIATVMITGDNAATALAVAREIGMHRKGDLVVTGAELDAMSDSELDKKVEHVRVYARVAPEHKLRIVNAWKRKGKVVAVTGDGVNDAPALKRSDIGIAMGITGTDVAKEVSDVVLADDNFASIVNAVEEGRGIYDNIRKAIAFLLSGNIAEVLIIFLAIMLGLPLPLVAIQLLWINMVTDGLPALALAMDPISKSVMERAPRPRTETIWRGMKPFLVDAPIIMTLACLAVLAWYSGEGLAKAQTMVFTLVIVFEKYFAFSSRSLERPVIREFFANRWLVGATILTFALHLAILYVPFLNTVFHTTPITLFDWAVVLGAGFIGFAYLEAYKAVKSRAAAKNAPAAGAA